jgi:hypothetical protein
VLFVLADEAQLFHPQDRHVQQMILPQNLSMLCTDWMLVMTLMKTLAAIDPSHPPECDGP